MTKSKKFGLKRKSTWFKTWKLKTLVHSKFLTKINCSLLQILIYPKQVQVVLTYRWGSSAHSVWTFQTEWDIKIRPDQVVYAFLSILTSISLPFSRKPFMVLQTRSAVSGLSKRTTPHPLDLPFSSLISAYWTMPADRCFGLENTIIPSREDAS